MKSSAGSSRRFEETDSAINVRADNITDLTEGFKFFGKGIFEAIDKKSAIPALTASDEVAAELNLAAFTKHVQEKLGSNKDVSVWIGDSYVLGKDVFSSDKALDARDLSLTPFHYACLTGNEPAIEGLATSVFIKTGIHAHPLTKSPLPIDFAEAHGHDAIVKVLQQLGSKAPNPTFVEALRPKTQASEKLEDLSAPVPFNVQATPLPFSERLHRARVSINQNPAMQDLQAKRSSYRMSRSQIQHIAEATAIAITTTTPPASPKKFADAVTAEREAAKTKCCSMQ